MATVACIQLKHKKHMCMYSHRPTHTQTHTHTDPHTHRHTDTDTDTHTRRDTHTQLERERISVSEMTLFDQHPQVVRCRRDRIAIPLQQGCSPVQVPLARHTTLLGPTSWNPGLQVKWTSWSTKYLLPNFLPSGGASRAGQETVRRRAGIRSCRPGLQA